MMGFSPLTAPLVPQLLQIRDLYSLPEYQDHPEQCHLGLPTQTAFSTNQGDPVVGVHREETGKHH
jgi:hypothetical protein